MRYTGRSCARDLFSSCVCMPLFFFKFILAVFGRPAKKFYLIVFLVGGVFFFFSSSSSMALARSSVLRLDCRQNRVVRNFLNSSLANRSIFVSIK